MKIFLDTADVSLIEQYYGTGLIDGVTTNPSLILKSGRDPEKVYEELRDLGIKDISMDVVGTQEQMTSEAVRLAKNLGDCCTVNLHLPCETL